MSDLMASIADFMNAHPITAFVILAIIGLVYGIGTGIDLSDCAHYCV